MELGRIILSRVTQAQKKKKLNVSFHLWILCIIWNVQKLGLIGGHGEFQRVEMEYNDISGERRLME